MELEGCSEGAQLELSNESGDKTIPRIPPALEKHVDGQPDARQSVSS